MSTIPYILKFNCMGEWARQQLHLFKLRDIYVAYCVRGLIKKVAERSLHLEKGPLTDEKVEKNI